MFSSQSPLGTCGGNDAGPYGNVTFQTVLRNHFSSQDVLPIISTGVTPEYTGALDEDFHSPWAGEHMLVNERLCCSPLNPKRRPKTISGKAKR